MSTAFDLLVRLSQIEQMNRYISEKRIMDRVFEAEEASSFNRKLKQNRDRVNWEQDGF